MKPTITKDFGFIGGLLEALPVFKTGLFGLADGVAGRYVVLDAQIALSTLALVPTVMGTCRTFGVSGITQCTAEQN